MPVQNIDKSSFYLVINSDYKDLGQRLTRLGFKVLFLEANICLAEPVAKHTDMQFITLKGKTFVLPKSNSFTEFLINNNLEFTYTSKAYPEYPKDVLCNAKLIGDKLFCNTKTIDKSILAEANTIGLNVIHVNQGYTGCSTLKVNDNSIITSDKSIYEAALKNNVEALLISEGFIKLEGYNHGFIGGCSGNIKNKIIIFSGSLESHPDKNKIREFIKQRNLSIIEFDFELTDIGGIGIIEI